MIKYYEVQRTRTCKAIGNNSDWQTWNKDTEQFKTIAEVKEFLKGEYGACKRVKQYQDDKNKQAKQTGWIYCYNTAKCSPDDQPKNNQDWITVKEIKATTILIN